MRSEGTKGQARSGWQRRTDLESSGLRCPARRPNLRGWTPDMIGGLSRREVAEAGSMLPLVSYRGRLHQADGNPADVASWHPPPQR